MNKAKRYLFGGVSGLVLAMPSVGYAQDAGTEIEEDSVRGGIPVIIVTAQKREQGANDVGITLNAFSGEELTERGVSSAEDIALLTPGLTVNETSATGVPVYTIRGVGFQDYSTGASSTVGLYFDEVAIPYTVMSRGAIFDIQRVEVLKGPQGDLYGRNTTAGQINYVSNKPTDTLEGRFSVGYSSFETIDVEGFVSGPVVDGVNARLAFTTTNSNKGWQKSLTRDDRLGKKNEYAVRGLVDIDLGEGNLLLKAQYVRDKSDNKANTAYDGRDVGIGEFQNPYRGLLPFLAPGAGDPPWYSTGDPQAADWTNSYTDVNGVFYNLRPERNNKLMSLAANLNYDITDSITFTSVTGYDKFDRTESNDWDGSPFNDSSNINTTDIEVFSQEVRLSGSMDRLDWVAGLYYSDDTVSEIYDYFMSDSVYGNGSIDFGVTPFQFSPIFRLNTRYDQDTESKAAFAHVEYRVTDAVRLTGGLRYTDEKRSWSGCTYDAGEGSLAAFQNFAFGASLAPGDCATLDDDPASPNNIAVVANPNDAFHVYSEEIRAKKWMWKLGADYELTDDILLYATYSHGFKSGGFNGANSNTTTQLKAYKPEELDSYEVGMKSALFGDTMQLNLAAFYYDYKNKQEQDLAVTFVGNISGIANVDKSRIYGAEMDLQWYPTDGLNLFFGAAWLDTKILEWEATSPASVYPNVITFDAAGEELAQSPTWQFNGGIEYQMLVSDGLLAGFGIDGNYKGSTTGGPRGPAYATDSYAVFNARVSLGGEDNEWKLTLWSRNLFDEYYYPAAYPGGNGPYVRSLGMPRTFGVTGDVRF